MRGFTSDLAVGNTVLVDDGLIGMEVTAIEGNKVICKVLNNGDLGENKGVNLPGVSIALPALAEKRQTGSDLRLRTGRGLRRGLLHP